ncbi:uncharacterized protein TRIREDRAFT_111429 [Trichoderma reesei QM6a]|uniref:Predicted protein n=1 Tax=Hypocrea jecorina (strain QM6a) TaxID=431241 RepID=G0RUJ5_HYPJQ|nr:uncharacterized protein TRIREDRAFT_111429 [Trichoderma reesei QM6a]EGR45207.1 predicted protein [Trichoderma reesei QM6a]
MTSAIKYEGVHREAVLLIASSWSFDGGTHCRPPVVLDKLNISRHVDRARVKAGSHRQAHAQAPHLKPRKSKGKEKALDTEPKHPCESSNLSQGGPMSCSSSLNAKLDSSMPLDRVDAIYYQWKRLISGPKRENRVLWVHVSSTLEP